MSKSKEFMLVVAIFALLFALLVIFSNDPARQNEPLTQEKLTCYEGILYFNMRYTYLLGAVIDSTTR